VEELPEGRNHVIIDTRHDPEEAIRDIIAILIETPGK
jgi:hypothetical protein